jgi:hypothetical protein
MSKNPVVSITLEALSDRIIVWLARSRVARCSLPTLYSVYEQLQ